MKYFLLIATVLLIGCSNVDKQEALNSCSFSEVKSASKSDKDSRRDDFMFACMKSKGYEFTWKDQCPMDKAFQSCWDYSWRVFL